MPFGIKLDDIEVFLLVFVRMAGLFVIAPIFGRRNIPNYLKIGFSFLVALILINTVKLPDPGEYENIYMYGLLVTKEALVGITMGYVSYLLFTAIYLAGQLIDMQIGFGVVNVLDPISNIQVPITANFYFILSMMVLLAVNGHHFLIRALFDSYNMVPLGKAVFGSSLQTDLIRVFGDMFAIGFKIAAPITAAILITDIALGILSRTVPQLNVFVVGMPLKIFLGVVVMFLTVRVFVAFTGTLVDQMNGETIKFIQDMGTPK